MTPWVRRLLIANVAMFALTMGLPNLGYLLAFQPASILARPWTVITYMFVHAGFWHIAFNMIALYFFGPRVEERLGSSRFLAFYILSGLGGAALTFLTPTALIVGASAATFGVQLAFARYWPRVQILIWGVLPIEARWLVVIMTFLSLRGGLSGSDGIAHWAHLGGYIAAGIFLLIMDRTSSARSFKQKAKAPRGQAGLLNDRAQLARWASIRAEDLHEVNRAELERIREVLKSGGAGKLTAGDREFLERFSRT